MGGREKHGKHVLEYVVSIMKKMKAYDKGVEEWGTRRVGKQATSFNSTF
jgi:hypothetical protein